MGLKTWKNSPSGKIIKSDVSIAGGHLNEGGSLDRFVTMYLDYAEDQAERGIPMTMRDWAKKLDVFMRFGGRGVLENSGKVTAEIAQEFAESEFGEYRIVQDRIFESDCDRVVKSLQSSHNGKS